MLFENALKIVLHHEGGYVDHPDDPGGATNMGITHNTLSEWRDAPVTKDDVKALPVTEAAEIYRARYWNPHCPNLPTGVDLLFFDSAVNQGPGRAAVFLQQAAGVARDGIIGPRTMMVVSHMDSKELMREFAVRRALHYASLNQTFRLGWFRRLLAVYEAALAEAASGA